MKLPKNNNRKAFTLLEVICVLIIISIVSSIALPALDNFYSSDRCKAEASILVSYIRQAKYEAVQDNTLNRIRFDSENGSYIVQRYEYNGISLNTTDSNLISEYNDQESVDSDPYGKWASIADVEEIEFPSSLEVGLGSLADKCIYFKPDGYLYDSTENMITEQRIIFKYGNSAIAVDINALGVISSEAIPSDSDEFDDDDEKEGDENED